MITNCATFSRRLIAFIHLRTVGLDSSGVFLRSGVLASFGGGAPVTAMHKARDRMIERNGIHLYFNARSEVPWFIRSLVPWLHSQAPGVRYFALRFSGLAPCEAAG